MIKNVFFIASCLLLCLSISLIISANNQPYEIRTLRTVNSKTYLISDNLYKTEYYTQPIHYLENLEYLDFDESFFCDEDKITTNKSNYRLTLPRNLAYDSIVFNYLSLTSFNLNVDTNYNFDLISYSKADQEKKCYCSNVRYAGNENILNIDVNTKGVLLEFSLSDIDSFSFSLRDADLVFNEIDCCFYCMDSAIQIYKINLPKYTYKINDEMFSEFVDYEIVDDGVVFTLNGNRETETQTINLLVENTLSLNWPVSRDKYIISNDAMSGEINNNSLRVGIDPFAAVGPGGNLINYDYRGIIELKIQPISNVVSAELSFTKQVISNSPYYNPYVKLYKITSHTYDQITGGNVSYSKTLVDSDSYYNTINTFDITNTINQCISSNNFTMVFELKGEPSSGSSGYATYYDSESIYDNYIPILTLTSSDITSGTGSASSYGNGNSNPNINCFAYALDQIGEYTPTGFSSLGSNSALYDYKFYNEFLPQLIIDISDKNYEARIINSYDALIFNYERRICCRIKYPNSDLNRNQYD